MFRLWSSFILAEAAQIEDDSSILGEEVGARSDSGTHQAELQCVLSVTNPFDIGTTLKISLGRMAGSCIRDGTGKSMRVPWWFNDVCECYGPMSQQDFTGGCPSEKPYGKCGVDFCSLRLYQYDNEFCNPDSDLGLVNSTTCQLPNSDNCALATEAVCAESLFHAGWDCFDDVMWAKNEGIRQHPEWYAGLNQDSSVEDFHAYISELPACSAEQSPPCAAHTCARPCYTVNQWCLASLRDMEDLFFMNMCKPDGHGGANMVHWKSATGSDHYEGSGPCPLYGSSGSLTVVHYADWNCTSEPNVTEVAYMDGDYAIHQGSMWTGTCEYLEPDSECASQVRWAMTEGIHSHPEWYIGLSADASWIDFQRYLSGLPLCSDNGSVPPCYGGSESCLAPCMDMVTTQLLGETAHARVFSV